MGQQFAEINAQVGIVLADAKLLTDDTAYVVVAPHFDVCTHFLAFQPKGVKTAVIDFSKPASLKYSEACLFSSMYLSY